MKTTTITLCLAVIGAAFVPAAARAQEDPHKGSFTLDEATKGLTGSGPLVATMETSKGTFTCELYGDKTPKTVANFVGLARGTRAWKDPKSGTWMKDKPFYDGLVFHRVIPNFMIQGGDPLGTGTGNPGYKFEDEIVADLTFSKKGQLAMANAGPGTNGSQFFITDGTPQHLNGRHTIFGQCEPASLAHDIALVPAARDRPTQDVVIKKLTVAYKKPGKGGGKKK